MKILYISELSPQLKNGGSYAAKRDLSILKQHFDVEETGVFTKENSNIQKVKNLLFSKCPILFSTKEVKAIENKIKTSDCDVVFLCSSLLGYFAKYAKKCNKKVITYFQNCEYQLFKSCRSKFWYNKVFKQEKLALEYSDLNLILNDRDLNELKKVYNYNKDNYKFYPITMEDKLRSDIEINDEKYGLFLGSWFRPNEIAVKYIIDNIADHINYKIKVIGYQFEKFDYKKHENVEIIGTVDDMAEYIQNASFMILPVFDGGGMKVKTCEAIMFGKHIIASTESLEGYKLCDHIDVCNTEQEYIDAINNGNFNKFNEDVRMLWKVNYSLEAAKKLLISVINSLK